MPARKPPIDTIPLFAKPEPATRPEPQRRSQLAHHKPRWSKYRPKNPVKCDQCMAVHAETGGRGPLAAFARFSRDTGDTKELLCWKHAQQQRARDGMPALKGDPR